MNKVARLLRTVRYLKPIQIYGRVWFRLYRPALGPAVQLDLRPLSDGWMQPVPKAVSMLAADSFCFLDKTLSIAGKASWNAPDVEKLWLYNLHYFDDLNAAAAAERHAWHLVLLQRWVSENPPAAGNGWEPYPTSLRIVNWVKWSLAGNQLPVDCLASLGMQARWLSKRLEWHLLGNHLFANAKALVFAGLFFQGREADEWLAKGLKIIQQQLPEQVLADGGNFELSPMYHAIFLEDVLDLLNIADAYSSSIAGATVSSWQTIAAKMLNWLEIMLHPDGELSLFNDAAIGIAPTFATLHEYAQRLGVNPPSCLGAGDSLAVYQLPASGYVRLQAVQAVALLDVAAVGPDYLPGHAHADTLSLELSVFGKRLVVNGGTSRYGLGPARLRERETAWHSTLELDGRSSSEVWGGFRVGRRAYPFDLQISARQDAAQVSCAHDGYKWLPGQPVHRRSWAMSPAGLSVSDSISNVGMPAVARFIFHPQVQVIQLDTLRWQLGWPSGETVLVVVEAGAGSIVEAYYAPEFGQLLPTNCLCVQLADGKAVTRFDWS